MIDQPMDMNAFYEQGFLETVIEKSLADRILSDLKKEWWLQISPDPQSDGEETEKGYENRYISARSMLRPNDLPESYAEYSKGFCDWAQILISQYATAQRHIISALFGSEGYYMDMHTDAGDRCPFTVILYLGSDLPEDRDIGGNLNIFEVDAHDPKNSFRKKHSVKPTHGKLAVLNNLDPTIYHSVDPLTENVARYQLLSSFGIESLPDWEFPLKEDSSLSGKILNPGGVPSLGIDDHDVALKIIGQCYDRGSKLPLP